MQIYYSHIKIIKKTNASFYIGINFIYTVITTGGFYFEHTLKLD
jgi:hypothetical protein